MEVLRHTPHTLWVLTLFSCPEIKNYLTYADIKLSKYFHIHETKHRKIDTRVFGNHLILLSPAEEGLQAQKFKRPAKGHTISQWSHVFQYSQMSPVHLTLRSSIRNFIPSLYLLCSTSPEDQHNFKKRELKEERFGERLTALNGLLLLELVYLFVYTRTPQCSA